MRKLFLTLIFILWAVNGFTATYYVDYVGGADTNNGTATATPFQHSPDDANATDTANTTTIAAGDTIIFKGGVIYEGSIDIAVSGTAGNIITYDGNSAGTFGTGKAIIQGTGYDGAKGTDEEYGFKAAASRSYITIQNFEIRGFGGGSDATTCANQVSINGYGIYFVAGGTFVTIKDCKIWDIGDWEHTLISDRVHMIGRGIYFTGTSSNITIDNIEIQKVALHGIYIATYGSESSVSDIEIKNCYFHSFTTWGIGIGHGTNSAAINSVNIHDNRFEEVVDYVPWIGCTGQWPHTNAIALSPNIYESVTFGTAEDPIRIHSNTFYRDNASTTAAGSSTIFGTGWGGTLYIYNNLFLNNRNGDSTIYFQGMDEFYPADYHIYNNTFYLQTKGITIRDLTGGNGLFANATAVDFSNNIVYSTNTGSSMAIIAYQLPMSNYTALNNNVIYTLRTDGKIASSTESGSTAYKTVTTLNALDNAGGNIALNPLFTDITSGLGANSSLNDLTLQSGSPAINIGTDFSAYFTTDFLGGTRPTGANTWDLGAYERGAEGDTTTPTLLSATIADNGTTLTLGFSEIVDTTINTGFTLTASGGAATLTYASGSGSNTLVYTISREIEQTENNPTIAYVQPGNGIEDTSDNDLASFSGAAVVNKSTQYTPPVYALTITKGTGIGSITSTPVGISCGSTCSYEYDGGTVVQLSISCVNEGWYVSGITGDCASNGSVTMSAAKACTVTCSQVPVLMWF